MSSPHTLLSHAFSLTLPHRLTEVTSWHEHVPFAFALVAAARPGVLVELGTHRGDSYCAFCQGVEGLALPTRCYAVDTWEGDEHAGRYGEEVFEELRAYHDPRYASFSRLVRSTFDEAQGHFPDGSVDLLHIDGLHTAEAVGHDFEGWKPKLSERAVVVFHDINVRERGFGVWRYWEEISTRHPSFAFVHGHGLGVLAVGPKAPEEILALCALAEAERAVVRGRFAALGGRVALLGRLDATAARLHEAEARAVTSQQLAERQDGRVQELELEAARNEERLKAAEREATRDRQALAAERDQAALRFSAEAAEALRRASAAEEAARGLREDVRSLRQESDRLDGVLRDLELGWSGRLVAWLRKNNRIRLAKRKARRGELVDGRSALLSLPGTTPVTGHGPIAWLRRKNRSRLARRKARTGASASRLPAPPRPSAPEAPPSHRPPGDEAPAAAPLGMVSLGHDQAWSAYPRLKAELARRRAARLAAVQVEACGDLQAPRDLAAYARALAVPEVAAPRVSIILPTRDRVRDALGCVGAVAAHAPSGDYELVVVDDLSSDETAAILPLVRNLRYLRNEARLGAIASASRGAREARGEYLVFLDDAAQVAAGWLPPLLDAFASFDRVGAAGPKVVRRDGRLEEAGTIINSDLSLTRIGQGGSPRQARHAYAREVQCCSGPCLVVPRRRFEEVGGFTGDLGTPAYERCDLQLKLRAIGLRTIYRPEAVVHLLEDGSAASPADPGLERRAVARSAQRMRERWGDVVDAMEAVRLIAFYLPQFHPIRENEFWWGKGFTEWTNVAKAQPCFVGHEQPHLPTELGFYDLRIPEVMHEQARLAQAYGISGFCYYYYWFDGKRLLEAPTERLLSEVPAALPFCLCWANENWTRRWDGGGGESEILMGQAHSDEDDEAVIRDLIRFLRHPSYIRVNGRPMLLVYRVGLFPDIRRTAALWRDACRREGLGEIHLVRVDSFEEATRATPPSHHGFDAAVEFPPHQIAAVPVQSAELLRPAFAGKILEYEEVVLQSVDYKDAGYPHYRTVLSRWDNTPRRQDAATIYANSSPGAYQAYLEEVLAYTREHSVGDDRVVFVNAWNEWAEGAHLEPDRRYGRTYLEATANAMAEHLVRRGVGGP